MDTQTTATMACPVCRTGLVMSERQGIEIDYCPGCRGIWLDRGELDKIVERSAAELAPAPRPGNHGYAGDHRHHGYRKRRKSFLEGLFD